MRNGPASATPGPDRELVAAASTWFVRHGLPYFVPEQREAARRALRTRRTVVIPLLAVLLGLAPGVPLAGLLGQVAFVVVTPLMVLGVVLVVYAATTLRAWPIATWAVARTLGSLRLLLPLATRALPLLLLFVTFLFINAEVWQVSAGLDGSVLWLTVMLFAAVAVVFLLVRLPEELENADGVREPARLVEACRRTPLEGVAADLVAGCAEGELADRTRVHGYERANLMLVLVITQAVQVLLLSLSVFALLHGVRWPGDDRGRAAELDAQETVASSSG